MCCASWFKKKKSAVIPFKAEMAIELQEKGRVRFWAQVGKFTENCNIEYVFNDNIVEQGAVWISNIFHWNLRLIRNTNELISSVYAYYLWAENVMSLIRNTRWALTRALASSRCSWTHWRSLMREPSPSTWWMERPRAAPVSCWLEKVRRWLASPKDNWCHSHGTWSELACTCCPPGGSLRPWT